MSGKSKILRVKIILVLVLFGLVFSSATDTVNVESSTGKVKNIILCIGDGMGIAQVSGAMTVSRYNLNMTTTRHIGFMRTQAFDNYITDSAASGTAMSTGKKTRNGMIGMGPDSTEFMLITELMRNERKMAYGVVSTSAVTHATPACFVAHNVDRGDYEGIALDFVRNQPEVFLGGGESHFNDRKDQRDLISVLQNSEYEVAFTLEDVLKTKGPKVAGLLSEEHLPKFSEGRGNLLALLTEKALNILNKNRRGFFLMVEGSQIDWGGHANNAQYVLEETYDFDIAVGEALKFAAEDGNTLVIVTADHETGGMTLMGGSDENYSVIANFSTGGHTGIVVPVFAFGPEADVFTGFYENTELMTKFKEVLRIQ